MRERKKPKVSWVRKTERILRMEKIKNAIKWIGTDGLLHFLVCYAITLTFLPIAGWWSLLIAAIPALGKEGYDYFIQKDNNKEQVIHDLICDAVGMGCALLVMGFWLIIK